MPRSGHILGPRGLGGGAGDSHGGLGLETGGQVAGRKGRGLDWDFMANFAFWVLSMGRGLKSRLGDIWV